MLKKCVAEATHEKRIAPIAATQIHSHAASVRKQSLHFYQSKNALLLMEIMNLCRKSMISHLSSKFKRMVNHSLFSLLLVCYTIRKRTFKWAAANGRNNSKKAGGKREGQKYKFLLVLDILLKKTDENHALQLKDIKEHLSHYGITAERHSIKRDIDDILALLNKELDFDLDELEIEKRELFGYKVEYDTAHHGYKVSRRPYDFEELRLLAECVRDRSFSSTDR